MAIGVQMDETGRIIEVVMDEHVLDPNSEEAVQAIDNPDNEVARPEHQEDVVLKADDPDAVQTPLPREEHPLLKLLSDEERAEAERRRAEAGAADANDGEEAAEEAADED